jgi:hypothetical protein
MISGKHRERDAKCKKKTKMDTPVLVNSCLNLPIILTSLPRLLIENLMNPYPKKRLRD